MMKIIFIGVCLIAGHAFSHNTPLAKKDDEDSIAPIANSGDNIAPIANSGDNIAPTAATQDNESGEHEKKAKSCLKMIMKNLKSENAYLHCINSLAHMNMPLKEKAIELLVDGCEKEVFATINVLDNLLHEEKRQNVKDEYVKCIKEYKMVLGNTRGALKDLKAKRFLVFKRKSDRRTAKNKIIKAVDGVKTCNQGLKKIDSTSHIAKKNEALFTSFDTVLQITVRILV